jgi:hypothetical protein
MQLLLHTKLKLDFVEKYSSCEGRITLSGGKLEDYMKMNPKKTQCLDMDFTELSRNGTFVRGNKAVTLL